MVETAVFSLRPSVHSSIILKRLTARFLWVAAIPVGFFLLMGNYVSATWYYLVPITVFLITPLFIFFAYFLASLNRESARALMPHSFIFTENGVIYRKYEAKIKEEQNPLKKYAKVTVYSPEAYELTVKEEFLIARNEIKGIEREGNVNIINLKSSYSRFIVIPFECGDIGDYEIGAPYENQGVG